MLFMQLVAVSSWKIAQYPVSIQAVLEPGREGAQESGVAIVIFLFF